MLDVHHRLPVRAALTTSFYAAPQEPVDAQRLFEAACASAGMDREIATPLPPSRAHASALILSREWGMTDLESRLVQAIEESYEPTWDRDRAEFTWGMGLGEEHPRGQFNAFLAAAEASGSGAWERLSAAPLAPCPQVVGVDVSLLSMARAEWIGETLHLRLAPVREAPHHRTTFSVEGVSVNRAWAIRGLDDAAIGQVSTGDQQSLRITVPITSASIEISPAS